MRHECSGEFGNETIEADSVELAALRCANNHAGLDCDEVCEDSWSFCVGDREFFVEYLNKAEIVVKDADGNVVE